MVVFPQPRVACFAGGAHLSPHTGTWWRHVSTRTRAPHRTGARRLLSPVLALVGAPRTLQRAHTHVVRHQVIDRPHREEPCEKCQQPTEDVRYADKIAWKRYLDIKCVDTFFFSAKVSINNIIVNETKASTWKFYFALSNTWKFYVVLNLYYY